MNVEGRRRALMNDDPVLYAYIKAVEGAKLLDRAGNYASGADSSHGAANRLWSLATTARTLAGHIRGTEAEENNATLG